LKILYVTSDWKWTGPAEPMLWAAVGLRGRGHRVELACPAAPDGQTGVLAEAGQRGIEPALTLSRARGIRPLRDRAEARQLRRLLSGERFDVVHAWHSRGHGLALQARSPGTVIVRAHSDGRVARWGESWLFSRGCDALVCTSSGCAASHSGRAAAHAIPGAVDLARFRPAAGQDEVGAARHALGLPPEVPVLGVIARVQPQRRFERLFDVLEQVCRALPSVRLVVLGRGTGLDRVARQPAAARGLADHVVFAGHRTGDAYAQALRAFDLLCFLAPGSDGGCRALLEAAASGVPAVALPEGAPGEIVLDGETGRLVEDAPAVWARVVTQLLTAPSERAKLGEQARRHAEQQFGVERLARDLERVYRAALPGPA